MRIAKKHLQGLLVSLIAAGGIVDTLYLVTKQFGEKEIGTCPIFGTGCGDVLGSVYSQFFGIPLSVWGVMFYTGMLIMGLLLILDRTKTVTILASIGALIGFLLSIAFLYIQGVLIGAFCFYCVLSAVTSTLLFFTMLPTIITFVLDITEKDNKE
jgi:uncharacterized membrane protein